MINIFQDGPFSRIYSYYRCYHASVLAILLVLPLVLVHFYVLGDLWLSSLKLTCQTAGLLGDCYGNDNQNVLWNRTFAHATKIYSLLFWPLYVPLIILEVSTRFVRWINEGMKRIKARPQGVSKVYSAYAYAHKTLFKWAVLLPFLFVVCLAALKISYNAGALCGSYNHCLLPENFGVFIALILNYSIDIYDYLLLPLYAPLAVVEVCYQALRLCMKRKRERNEKHPEALLCCCARCDAVGSGSGAGGDNEPDAGRIQKWIDG